MIVVVDKMYFSKEIIILPEPLRLSLMQLVLKFERFSGMGDGFGIEVGIVHVVLSKCMVHLDKNRMPFS